MITVILCLQGSVIILYLPPNSNLLFMRVIVLYILFYYFVLFFHRANYLQTAHNLLLHASDSEYVLPELCLEKAEWIRCRVS